MTKKTEHTQVLIYGGGIAGAILAKHLSRNAAVTVVDPHDYFEVPMAAPRNLVCPQFAEQAILPFVQIMPKVRFIQGKLRELGKHSGVVQLSDGTFMTLSADVTVLATGSNFANPLMRAFDGSAVERKAYYRQYRDRIAASRRIVIVGGGPIGVEVAGEITESFPEKQVTIIESAERLLAGTSQEAAEHAEKILKARGVIILTAERVIVSDEAWKNPFAPGGEIQTSSGSRLAYDLLIWCAGGKPNTHYMKAHYSHVLNSVQRIRVTPHLRVVGCETLFALGDITDLDENKMAWHIAGQVKHAAHNIQKILGGNGTASQLKIHEAETGNPAMAITLGSREGVTHLPRLGVLRAPWINRLAKAGHMLVPKYRKALGV